MKLLLVFAWSLVALEATFLAVMALNANLSDEDSAGRRLASGFTVAGALVLAALSGLLLFTSRHGSVGIVSAVIMALLLPVVLAGVPTIAGMLRPCGRRNRAVRFAQPELTAVAGAIAANDVNTVFDLVRKRPDLMSCDENGETLFSYAIDNALTNHSSLEAIRALLDAGVDPNRHVSVEGKPVILQAFESASPISTELFKLLLDRGANPNTRDLYGVPMLHHTKGQFLKLKLLVDNAADINAVSDYQFQRGWTPVMALAMDEAYDEALYLVQRGAGVHHVAPDGASLISVMERRRAIAGRSASKLPDSYRALLNAITVHARRR